MACNSSGNIGDRRNVRKVCNQMAQTTKNVKVPHQKMKPLPEKPPFVIGIVHHRIGSPYKSETNSISARTRSNLLNQKTNIQNKNRGLHSKPAAKRRFEPGGPRENTAAASGPASALEVPQKCLRMCKEINMKRDPAKCEKINNRNVNESQSSISTTVNSAAKQTSAHGEGTNSSISEDKENHQENGVVNIAGYREELDKVVIELESSCNEWMQLSAETNQIPDEITELINIAVGQTKLLIREKLQQYHGLISECASSSGPLTVTEDDLQGFWAMVSIQVCDVRSKFENLATLKQNGWKEPERVLKLSVPKRKSGVKQSNSKRVALRSSLREHIAAMRKKKKAVDEEDRKSLLEENPLVSV